MSKDKSEQLGISYSKASHILRKRIMFNLVKQCDMDICYRCGEKIKNIDELSIEHKIPWMHSNNPSELYFSLDNIAFSHLKCNVSHGNTNKEHGKQIKTKSKITNFKGVAYIKQSNIYCSRIWDINNKKNSTIGYYNDPKIAAIAYDNKAIELYGDKAVTNKQMGLL